MAGGEACMAGVGGMCSGGGRRGMGHACRRDGH